MLKIGVKKQNKVNNSFNINFDLSKNGVKLWVDPIWCLFLKRNWVGIIFNFWGDMGV